MSDGREYTREGVIEAARERARQRMAKRPNPPAPPDAVDIIIPLSSESRSDNDELRLLLRSIEANVSGVGRICVATTAPPAWLTGCEVVPVEDALTSNKDGNLIDKVARSCEHLGCDRFAFCADDNAFLQPVHLPALPKVYNPRGADAFWPRIRDKDGRKELDWIKWHRRMLKTIWLAEGRGIELRCNFDAHVPQVFSWAKIRGGLASIDYRSGLGYCIYTLFRILEGCTDATRMREQDAVKVTMESASASKEPLNRLFCGYNDAAFLAGLRERLFALFPKKSKYEAF